MFVDTFDERKVVTLVEAHIPGVGAWNSSKLEEMLENTTFPRTNQKCAAYMQEKMFLLSHPNGKKL